jgi:hypothetical protein
MRYLSPRGQGPKGYFLDRTESIIYILIHLKMKIRFLNENHFLLCHLPPL